MTDGLEFLYTLLRVSGSVSVGPTFLAKYNILGYSFFRLTCLKTSRLCSITISIVSWNASKLNCLNLFAEL
jgi:hypothetical protein